MPYIQNSSANVYREKPAMATMLANGFALLIAVASFVLFFLGLLLGYEPKVCILIMVLAAIAGWQTAKNLD